MSVLKTTMSVAQAESTAQIVLFKDATGELRYKFTNDYLFRAIFQRNNTALRGLICALLGIEPAEIRSVEITNPIELGDSISAKDFFLDIRVMLNDDTLINLEMQVLNYHNFPERSLGYLCRSFDHLNRGQDYLETKSVIQVCFLDFTLFEDMPEFCSSYKFLNEKNYHVYSDKLRLTVVDLTKIDMATEEDKRRGIEYWAKLFKATTWEEIKMLTEDNTYLQEAASTAYQLSAEEKIRLQCEAREDYYKLQRSIAKRQKILEEQYEEGRKAIALMDETLVKKNEELAKKDEEIARLKALLAQRK